MPVKIEIISIGIPTLKSYLLLVYFLLYNKTRHSYIYMFPIAGQTTGPIGLKFFVDTLGWPRAKKS